MMEDTVQFMTRLTDDFKNNYSRAMYSLLMKQDLAFRYNAKKFQLRKDECSEDDRFIFLFLCKKMLEARETELAQSIYCLRAVGFSFSLAKGIAIRPTEKWNTAEEDQPSNKTQRFRDAWLNIPEAKRNWVKEVLNNISADFPEFPCTGKKIA